MTRARGLPWLVVARGYWNLLDRRRWRFFRRAFMTGQPSQLRVDLSRQLVGAFTYGLIQRRGIRGRGNRGAAIKPRLDHAAFVILATFAAVLVAEMNIHAADAVAETIQRLLHDGTHVGRQRLMPLDVGVGVHVYFHVLSCSGASLARNTSSCSAPINIH